MAGRMREGGSRDNVDRGRIEASEALFSLGPLVTGPRCHGLRQGEVGAIEGRESAKADKTTGRSRPE
jgi:hypothetical protein